MVSPEIKCDNNELNMLDHECLFSDILCAIKPQISLCINYSEIDKNTSIKNRIENVEWLASHPKTVQWDKTKPLSLFSLSICQTLRVLCNPYKKGKSI